MEDIQRCGNIVPKFPGGPPQSGISAVGIVTAGLLPSLAGTVKVDPSPDPWKGQAGVGY